MSRRALSTILSVLMLSVPVIFTYAAAASCAAGGGPALYAAFEVWTGVDWLTDKYETVCYALYEDSMPEKTGAFEPQEAEVFRVKDEDHSGVGNMLGRYILTGGDGQKLTACGELRDIMDAVSDDFGDNKHKLDSVEIIVTEDGHYVYTRSGTTIHRIYVYEAKRKRLGLLGEWDNVDICGLIGLARPEDEA